MIHDVAVYNQGLSYPALVRLMCTNPARTFGLFSRGLYEDASLEIDGEYLKPHGGRRGLGHELYSKGHAELAQTALRHSSIETTHESYSDIQATETAKRVDDVLE